MILDSGFLLGMVFATLLFTIGRISYHVFAKDFIWRVKSYKSIYDRMGDDDDVK